MPSALPSCPTCAGPLTKDRLIGESRETRHADGSQELEITGEVDADGHAILTPVNPSPGDATTRVWVFDVSCAGCLSVLRVEYPDREEAPPLGSPHVVSPASEIARLRERLVRARDDGRLEAELTNLRLSDQFRLLGVPEIWKEAKRAIPEKMRLVVNAGWRRPPSLSPLGLMPVTLGRERFNANVRGKHVLPSGGGIVIEFHAFLAGTRFFIQGVRNGKLRITPIDMIPDAYDLPNILCAAWDLFGKLDD